MERQSFVIYIYRFYPSSLIFYFIFISFMSFLFNFAIDCTHTREKFQQFHIKINGSHIFGFYSNGDTLDHSRNCYSLYRFQGKWKANAKKKMHSKLKNELECTAVIWWVISLLVCLSLSLQLPVFLDFLVTWTALSNSLWNPLMYWMLNVEFRHLSRRLLTWRVCVP